MELITQDDFNPGRIGGHSFHANARYVSGTKASFNEISRVTLFPYPIPDFNGVGVKG